MYFGSKTMTENAKEKQDHVFNLDDVKNLTIGSIKEMSEDEESTTDSDSKAKETTETLEQKEESSTEETCEKIESTKEETKEVSKTVEEASKEQPTESQEEETAEEEPIDEPIDEPQLSLAERLKEKVAQEQETRLTEEKSQPNSILDQYIKAHKSNYKGASWEEGVGLAIVAGQAKTLEEANDNEEIFDEEKQPQEEVSEVLTQELTETVETVEPETIEETDATKETSVNQEETASESENEGTTEEQEESNDETTENAQEPEHDEAIPTPIPEEALSNKVLTAMSVEDIETVHLEHSENYHPRTTKKAKEVSKEEHEDDSEEETSKISSVKKVALIAAGIAVIGGVGYAGYSAISDSMLRNQAIQQAQERTQVSDLTSELTEFYTDGSRNFIRNDRLSDVTGFMDRVHALHGVAGVDTLRAEAEELNAKAQLTQQVNALFTTPAIVDGQLNDNLILANFSAINITVDSPSEALNALANQAIEKAREQYHTMNQANEKIESLLEGDTNEATDSYNETVALINNIQNETIRNEFLQKLAPSQANENTTEEQTAPQAVIPTPAPSAPVAIAPQVPQVTPISPVPDTTQTVGAEAGGDTLQQAPSAFNNQAQAIPMTPGAIASVESIGIPFNQTAIDTPSAAWVWGVGVQERFIQTVIERGYITANSGFGFVPINIVNGEGYYSLVDANGNFIVIVNAQTGWFMGHGGRQRITNAFDPETARFGS